MKLEELARKTAEKVIKELGLIGLEPMIEPAILSALQEAVKEKDEVFLNEDKPFVMDWKRGKELYNKLVAKYPDIATEVAQLITSNLDLSITWVDGKAWWGVFALDIMQMGIDKTWWARVMVRDVTNETLYTFWAKWDCLTQELAEAACVDALKIIVTGGKS